MNDTDPKMEALYRRLLMARTAEERFMMGIRMCESARAMVLASLPENLSPLEQKIALLRRYYHTDFTPEALAKIETAMQQRATSH